MAEYARREGFRYMDLDDFEDYLADKPEHERWELIGGRVVKMMVGARVEHHLIVQNITFALMSRFRDRGSDCRTYSETFWLKRRFLRLAVFPDVMVHCGRLPPESTSLDDPVVLFEVVSPGSEERDRWEKWSLYQKLEALQHYVLVERDQGVVDVIDRASASAWSMPRRIEGLERSVALPALDLEIPLAEIYRDVFDA